MSANLNLLQKPEVGAAIGVYDRTYDSMKSDPDNAKLAARYMASQFLKTNHKYDDVDPEIAAIEEYRKQHSAAPVSSEPANGHGVATKGAEAAGASAVAVPEPYAEGDIEKHEEQQASGESLMYWRWLPYDENEMHHVLIRQTQGVEHNGEVYVPIVLSIEADDLIKSYFEKHKHLPSGVTLRGEGPDKAYWPSHDGFTLTRMSTVTKKKIKWLWKNRFPAAALSTIAGDPDCGKSLLSLYIAACVTRGLPFHGDDEPTPQGEVLVLSAEDDPENTLAPRLEAAGANLSKVHLLQSVMMTNQVGQPLGDRLAQLDVDVQVIMRVLATNPRIRLIIIDPVSSFLGNAGMNKEQEVRKVLMPLVTKAREANVTVIQIVHFNKNSEAKSAMDRVGGAKAFVGLGRSAWTCVREPKSEEPLPEGAIDQGERLLFLKLKGNLAPSKIGGLVYTMRTREVEVLDDQTDQLVKEDIPFIQFLESTDSTAQEVVIDGKKTAGRPKKVTGCEDWLRDYLALKGGYARSGAILGHGNDAGYSDRTIYRAKDALKLESWYVDRVAHWGYNAPPKSETDEPGTHGGKRDKAGRKRRNTVDLAEGASQTEQAA